MTKLTAQAAGTFAIAPTPFHDDGRIDEKSIDRLTDFYAEVGCDGVTVLGILGEAPKLDAAEAEQVAVRFVKRAKNMQIIVGVSAPGFASMRSLAKASMDAGAAGVMIAPPPHLRTDDQITGYFKQAQEAVGDEIPWVLQDYPLTLNVIFTPAVIRKIVMDSPSCVMLKHEDWPGLEKITTLRGYQKDGSLKPMSILVGNGGLFLDFEMERGADGAMTGYAFPGIADRCREAAKGRQTRCRARSVRRASAADPLRAAARRGAFGAQIRAAEARHHLVQRAAQAGCYDYGDRKGRSRLSAVAGGARRSPRQSATAIQRGRLEVPHGEEA
ncbi:dihydrodipicolinate synthase/N-acetylneuraminate lyase [Bradyrhizobium sp. URHC0002]